MSEQRDRDEMGRIVNLQERLDADWASELARSKSGSIIADERNVLLAMRRAPEFRGLLHFNAFAEAIEFARAPNWRAIEPNEEWTDQDSTVLLSALQQLGLQYRSRQGIADCVAVVARDNRVHPVREYLEQCVQSYDGTPRLDSWLLDYAQAVGPELYLRDVGRAWLISAVARIFEPGAKADHVLIFEGVQGERKSTAANSLVPNDDWFVDSVGDLGSKDSAQLLSGHWIVELSELAAMTRPQIETVKAFISRKVDKYRPPYGRHPVSVPRQCIFIGSTNEDSYLKDRSGNRRFWPVKCGGRIRADELARDRNQLWGEAVVAYRSREPWWLSDEGEARAQAQQSYRMLHTEIEADIIDYVERQVAAGFTHTTTRQIFQKALRIEPGDFYHTTTQRLAPQVAAALQAAGCKKVGPKGRGSRKRILYELPSGRFEAATRMRIDDGEIRNEEF